jgi:4-carboxymuconolactone decarboxylase
MHRTVHRTTWVRRLVGLAASSLFASLFASPACAEQRLPTIPPAQYTPEQKKAADDFEVARKAPVFGPFEPLMHSPEVMTLARSMGDYLRYKSSIGNTLSELVILVTAREWTQDFEFTFHLPIALKAGIRKDVADAIADGRRPTGMNADEEMIYDFTTELMRNKRVSDTTFEKVKARFGTKGVVDTTGIVGYYTLLAMQLNVAQYRNPNDPSRLPRLPE